jgi:hypothetical protein
VLEFLNKIPAERVLMKKLFIISVTLGILAGMGAGLSLGRAF